MAADETQPKDGRTALHWAARNGYTTVCRFLVGEGVDPDVETRDQTRPLHWAVWQARLETCRFLVCEAGADIHARNAYGCNAVQWAAQTARDDEGMCRWLRAQGLDLSLLNRNGHSALHKAAVKGHRHVCECVNGHLCS